jgi:Zn-dependent metalloprotease
MDNNNRDVKDGADKVVGRDQIQEAAKNLFDDFAKTSGAMGDRAVAQANQVAAPRATGLDRPAGLVVVPPYLLREMANRNPNNKSFAETLNKTEEMLTPKNPVAPSVVDDNAKIEVYDAKGKEQHPGDKARFEGEPATGDKEVDDTYEFAEATRGFYKDVFNRNSIDDKGMKMISTVNYGDNYENAFWNGTQMTYGRPGKDSPFKTFVLMDVAGHEVTHGVTEKISGMIYYGQSGALNEHVSDVFGELIQQKAKGITADKADWLIGDGIWKDNIKASDGVSPSGLRNMLNPGTAYNDASVGKDPQPGHMKDYVQTWGDNGGVHYNSGIPNRAFATFAIAVGGNAWEKPGQIWYEALKNAGNNPSFQQFAQNTIDAANKLGYTAEVQKLQKAWEDVGITPSAKAVDNSTPGAAEKREQLEQGQKPDHDHDHGGVVPDKKDASINARNRKAA